MISHDEASTGPCQTALAVGAEHGETTVPPHSVNQDMIKRTRASCHAYKTYLEKKKKAEDKRRKQEKDQAKKAQRLEETQRWEEKMKAEKEKNAREEAELEAEEKKHQECLKNTEWMLCRT